MSEVEKAPYNFVADGIAVGGLLAYGESLAPFDVLMNVAAELNYVDHGDDREVQYVDGKRVYGVDLYDTDQVNFQAEELQRAVKAIAFTREHGKTILVTCREGRNRSALAVAEYLIQTGLEPSLVVSTIQSRRRDALTNEAFVEWLLRNR